MKRQSQRTVVVEEEVIIKRKKSKLKNKKRLKSKNLFWFNLIILNQENIAQSLIIIIR